MNVPFERRFSLRCPPPVLLRRPRRASFPRPPLRRCLVRPLPARLTEKITPTEGAREVAERAGIAAVYTRAMAGESLPEVSFIKGSEVHTACDNGISFPAPTLQALVQTRVSCKVVVMVLLPATAQIAGRLSPGRVASCAVIAVAASATSATSGTPGLLHLGPCVGTPLRLPRTSSAARRLSPLSPLQALNPAPPAAQCTTGSSSSPARRAPSPPYANFASPSTQATLCAYSSRPPHSHASSWCQPSILPTRLH